MLDTVPAIVKAALIPTKRVALAVPVTAYAVGKVPVNATEAPIILVVPVPAAFAYPMVFPVTVYPSPDWILIP